VNKFILSLVLVFGALPASAAGPKTYAEAQNALGWLSVDTAAYRKNLRQSIQAQTANLETMKRLEQTKAKVEEMIQRDNISKACKVVDVGFTVATAGAGGIALAAEEGLSVLTREGAKVMGKYIGQKGAVEAGKEAAGVPGYSDSVKAGMFVFNKFDENELRTQLSKDNVDALLKAKSLLEDESDGRTLKEKLPELRQLIFDMQDQLDKTATDIKASDSLIDKTIAEAKKVAAEAELLKAAEEKAADAEYEAAKKAKPSGLVNTEVTRPAEVPQPAAAPKETPEERRRRIQDALDKYINSLSKKFAAEGKAAEAAWSALKSPDAGYPGQANDLLSELGGLEEKLGQGGYAPLQEAEYRAKYLAGAIKVYRAAQENYRAEIRAAIEPVLGRMTDIAGQWRGAYRSYKPQGFYVAEPPDIEKTTAWTGFYYGPLTAIEQYKVSTEGLDGKFAALASQAESRKNAVYAGAKAAADDYAAKAQAFKAELPQTAAKMQAAMEEFNKKAGPVTGLPGEFVSEFAYNGKHDLANLEPKIAAAKRAFSEAQGANRAAVMLYYALAEKRRQLEDLAGSPLMGEAGYIRYGARNEAHLTGISAAMKPFDGWTPGFGETGVTDGALASAINGLSDTIFAADDALRYLRDAEKRMLAAAAAGAAALKANYAADLSRLKTASDEDYGREMEKLAKPWNEADAKLKGIQEEVRSTFLFDPSEELKPQKLAVRNTQYGPMVEGKQPLLFQTGFWPASVVLKAAEAEKISADFWAGPQGKEIYEARRLKELTAAQDKRDPGVAAVRKMYDAFRAAYESRNAARVMACIARDWTAGDGTTASDLDEQFNRIFRVYDEIKVEITGLQIVGDGNGLYTASYNMTIRSRIYKKNIKREESSSVYEHVAVEGGAARIKKTEAGGYWNVK